MPYLAIDTATGTLTVAVGEPGVLLGETTTHLKKNHSNRLMPLIDSLLDDVGILPKHLQGIVVGRGPGSYTGVRIGVATGKMMAWALQIPLLGISSLDGLAGNFSTSDGVVCPMFDARRKRVYTALYQREEGVFTKVMDDSLLSLDQLFSAIRLRLERRKKRGYPAYICFNGDGAQTYRSMIEETFGADAYFPERPALDMVKAGHLLDQGIPLLLDGKSEDISSFAPEYLQLAEAEAKWLSQQEQAKQTCCIQGESIDE